MFERELFEQYRLRADHQYMDQSKRAFRIDDVHYRLIPAYAKTDEEIYEIKLISDFFQQQGDFSIPSIIPTVQHSLISYFDQRPNVLLRYFPSKSETQSVGKQLAAFHRKGDDLAFLPQQINHFRKWKDYWSARLDQLEYWWEERRHEGAKNKFEQVFIETFPYFIGQTENAIQYIVDTQLDYPQSYYQGSVCYNRFTFSDGEKLLRKDPTDWVFDHRARDLAEWIRSLYWTDHHKLDENLIHFLNDYERVYPLGAEDWRNVYGRLLFPLHYFEAIEGYYTAENEEKKSRFQRTLFNYVAHSQDYERFLGTFYQKINLPHERHSIPVIKWLQAGYGV